MKEKTKLFKGLSENAYWLPFIATLMDAHNRLMVITNNDDKKYCNGMMVIHDLLLPLYGDNKIIDTYTYNKVFQVFIYVIEFVYGNPYSNENKITSKYAKPIDIFNNIKKHWNDDINKELLKVKNANK